MSSRMVLRAQSDLCDGCRMCELACSLKKTGIVNPHLARIRVTFTRKGPAERMPRPIICRHCYNARCSAACPIAGAMVEDARTGALVIDDAKCNRCMACVRACPFGAMWVGPRGEIVKCDLCDGDPVCVKRCPYRPANSLPNLPYPQMSCLQYLERSK